MKPGPIQLKSLRTDRLVLRAHAEADVPAMVRLYNDPEIARTTLGLQSPYREEHAREWVERGVRGLAEGDFVCWAITLADGTYIGSTALTINTAHERAELSYVIGTPWWGKGYTTEAAHAVMGFGFHALDLGRIWAGHLRGNDASGRVMQKLGMRYEGIARAQLLKDGEPCDDVVYGMLRSEYTDDLTRTLARSGSQPPAGAQLEPFPRLRTPRLELRRFTLDDVPEITRLCGDKRIAATTLLIPHPYSESDAVGWVRGQDAAVTQRRDLPLAITSSSNGSLVGAIGLSFATVNPYAELGYWIGVEHWGKGYATEAGAAIVDHGFTRCGLERIVVEHMLSNPASGRVIEKLGFVREGTLREHHHKWGEIHDMAYYGLLKREWAQHRAGFSWLEGS